MTVAKKAAVALAAAIGMAAGVSWAVDAPAKFTNDQCLARRQAVSL